MPLEPALDSTASSGRRPISVIGTGYVGLVTALAFAHHGHRVTCVDIIPERVDAVSRGEAPFFEPGVTEALTRHVKTGSIDATMDTEAAVAATEVTFLCVGTPSALDGTYDLTYLRAAARDVGRTIRDLDRHHVVVTKSTVTPTANRQVVLPEIEATSGRTAPEGLSLVSNPEFLREGSALADALDPDRVVIGLMEGDGTAEEILMDLYRPFDRPVLVTSIEGAELVKLASNSLLAIKVAFANEVANVAAAVGADGYQVLEGVGMDHRLGPHFLRAGAGFGGSCFPKDLRALVGFSESLDLPALMPSAALEQNRVQPGVIAAMVRLALDGDVVGRRVALLGLAFKPQTDDVRETRAMPIYRQLTEWGVEVICHDPQAGANFTDLVREEGLPDPHIVDELDDALEGAVVVVVQTEWEEYQSLDPAHLVSVMARPVLVDARRALDPLKMERGGVTYLGVGHPGP
ncbi:MAG: UDP-glucose/GDP-mannose dehydrogenase family protein [Thermoplasmata archaeon]|nr:UDP-glucose/GDP-mannose dehydrogenase family protein [Thermoplasmata archaeon]